MRHDTMTDAEFSDLETLSDLDTEVSAASPAEPQGSTWQASPYHSSRRGRAVVAVIYHFTAGPRLDGTVRYFKKNDRNVSAHYVIGKNGEIVHMVPLDTAAHHAGKGALPDGQGHVNARSVGIEVVNWGRLRRSGGKFLTHSGKAYAGPAPVHARGAWWEPFTEAQYEALIQLTKFLVRRLPTIRFVTGHEDVALPRGRKNDPGGAFDWNRIRTALVPTFGGRVGALPVASATRAPAQEAEVDEVEGEAFNVQKAVLANRTYAARLGWNAHYDRIVALLGFTDRTPDEALFAESMASWQARQGLGADGIVGPNTWARISSLLGLARSNPPAASSSPVVDALLPSTAPGLRAYGADSRRYGASATVAALTAVGRAWHARHPTGPRIQIGDISFRGGGDMKPHKSHRTGLDVDIRPVRRDGREEPVTISDTAYSRTLTQELVDLLRSNGVAPVATILFNDSGVRGVKDWPGHNNHLHVRFALPSRTQTELEHEGEARRVRKAPAISRARYAGAAIKLARRAVASTARGASVAVRVAPSTIGPLGTLALRKPDGTSFSYRFTPEDALWTTRFILGEMGGRNEAAAAAVIHAMFNRYALFTNRLYPTFAGFLRAYSTPLQPVLKSSGAARRHRNNPDFVSAGGVYEGTDVPRGQLGRHHQLQAKPWDKLPASARALALRALRGELRNPGIGNASEFASTFVYYKDRHKKAPTEAQWREFTQAFTNKGR